MAALSIGSRVRIVSYNLFGLNQGKSLLTDLCNTNECHIIMTQEHWQTPMNMQKIINFSSNYSGYGVSAMEGAVSTSILRGRPWGGVCTLVHNELASQVKCLMCSERFVILVIGSVFIINVYLPSYSRENHMLIETIFSEIHNIICLHPEFTIIVGGNFNSDLSGNSNGSRLIKEFMTKLKLVLCTDIIFPSNSSYTFRKNTENVSSFIDYFMISGEMVHQLI